MLILPEQHQISLYFEHSMGRACTSTPHAPRLPCSQGRNHVFTWKGA